MYRLTVIYFTLDSNTIYCFLLSMKLSRNAYRLKVYRHTCIHTYRYMHANVHVIYGALKSKKF